MGVDCAQEAGWSRALLALTSRPTPLAGVQWSCLRINKQAYPPGTGTRWWGWTAWCKCHTAAVRGITTADLEGCKDIRSSVIGVCSYRHAVVGVDCAQEARDQTIVDQISIEHMKSDHKRKASRGSKRTIYGTSKTARYTIFGLVANGFRRKGFVYCQVFLYRQDEFLTRSLARPGTGMRWWGSTARRRRATRPSWTRRPKSSATRRGTASWSCPPPPLMQQDTRWRGTLV